MSTLTICSFATRKGITRVNNSYYYEDINPRFDTSAFNAGNASHNWGIASLDTTGLGKIEGANFTSQDGSSAALVLNGASNMIIRDFFINTVNGWVGIFANGSGDLLFDNVGMGSENGTINTIQALAIFNDNTNVNWNGGGLYPLTNCLRQCNVLIDKGAGNTGPAGTGGQYRFNFDLAGHSTYIASHFSCPPGHAPTFPIILESAYQGRGIEGLYPWSDGYANVVVQPLETNGRSVYATTSSAAITCQWMTPQPGTVGSGPDFSCGTLVITDTGNFLTGTTVVNPPPNFAFAGYTRTVVAPSTHAIIFGGVTIQPSQSVTLESNGTSNWSIVAEFPITTNVANYLVTQLSTTTGIIGATILIDGYAAANDGGQGFYSWNPTYTGPTDPLNIYPNGGTTGAWQRLRTDPLYSVRWFGAKGDGSTDDTAAIQQCINTIYNNPFGTLYFPVNPTNGPGVETFYNTSAPLFLGGGGFPVLMDTFTNLRPTADWAGPAIFAGQNFPDPTYGTSGGLTYVHIGDATFGNFYNLATTPMNNILNWGDGYAAFTTAPFTVPSILGNVVVAVNQTGTGFTNSLGGSVYIQNCGLFACGIQDPTHLTLTYLGALVASDVSSGTINAGAGVSHISTSEYTGATPGFTFECFIDPITNYANGTANNFVASSSGVQGSNALTQAFGLSLYNDQVTAQTSAQFSLSTAITGVTTLKSGSHTLPIGTLTHVACVYDGVATMSLYIAGTRAATATVHGKILQGWYELFCLGLCNETYPDPAPSFAAIDTKIAGIGISPIAKYSGTSFVAPTTVPTPITRLSCSVIDFANRPNVIGPGGVNYATGWVLAHCPNAQTNVNGSPCWLQVGQGGGLSYVGAPIMTNVNISMGAHLGEGIYTWSALDGIFENCYVNGGTRGITLAGYSYRNRMSNCSMSQGYGGNNDIGVNQYSWCFGVCQGSQYAIIDGGYCQGGAWNIISNVFAGISISGLWLETVGIGGIGLFGQGSPAATLSNIFFQSDLGTTNLGNSICALYLYSLANCVVNGGYLAANFSNATPQLIVDSCTNVSINGCWMVNNPGFPALTNQNIVKFVNQTLPVFVNTSQAYVPFTIPNVYTTFHVINGSASVTASTNTVLAIPGTYVRFDVQPNTTYVVETVDPTTGNVVLNLPYSGATTTAAVLTSYGFPWMPEDGYAGQGPLYLVAQEDFGVWVVNMIASTGMTLLINDFLWGVIRFTDDDSLLSGTVKVTLPLIAGYSRRMINTTTQSLTLGGVTGSTVTLTSNSATTIACDGTNWFLA